MGTGEWAALAAALAWTMSSMIWGRIQLPAMSINLCKNMIGTLIIGIHLLVLLILFQQPLFSAPLVSWYWLGLSGIVGVGIGDTLYFRSLQILGPRRALMMSTTGPIFSVVLGWAFLDESLGYLALTGICLTVSGVVLVVADRKAKSESPGLVPGSLSLAILAGSLAAVCQAVGGVLSKLGMRSADGIEICGAAEATFIRLAVSSVAVLVMVAVRGNLVSVTKQAFRWPMLKLLIPATALGTWLGILLSQIAYSHSPVAIAQTLLSTCPIFAIPIVWVFHKHRVTLLAMLGTAAAVLGIYLAVYGK